MSGEGQGAVMLIGLHRLAAQNGDGLVPELYALLMRERRLQAENPNVATFPVWEARPPARDIPFAPVAQAETETGDNVTAFPSRAVQVERRKDLPETG